MGTLFRYLQEESILCVLRDVVWSVGRAIGDERVEVIGGSVDE